MGDNNHAYVLTIPNFVATEGCTVTFKAPRVPLGNAWTYIQINSGMWALRTPTGQLIEADAWVANATISVTLSFQIFQVAQSGDGRGGTAFFKAGGASAPKFPTYTGAHAIFGTEKQGYMELYSSGTLTAQANMTVEAFLVGGGASGGSPLGSIGGGGGSGYVKLLQGVNILKSSQYPVVIGAGGVAVTSGGSPCVAGGSTSIFSNTVLGGKTAATVAHGSDGGSGGGEAGNGSGSVPGGDGGRNGANGVETTTLATAGVGAGISTIFNGKEYAGGGGGGGYLSVRGGLGFAGAGNGGLKSQPGEAALANTGSGGGGGGSGALSGGNGGSGIVIIRWGY